MKLVASLFIFLASCRSTPGPRSTEPLIFVPLPAHKQRSQYESGGREWIITSQGKASTAAAAEVLKNGGNLFDAFTALSFTLGVERPHSTGLGGGGFVLFYLAKEKKVFSLDFRETAPRKAHKNMFLGHDGKPIAQKSQTGALSVATPGLVSGVLQIQKKYGRLPLKDVISPAVRLASQGFPIYPALHRALSLEKTRLALFPSTRKIFLSPDGEAWPEGHRLLQLDLAKTLQDISISGSAAFYRGATARRIVASLRAEGGILDLSDLKDYRTKWREPVRSTFHQYEIFSQPPPSSGGTHVIQILNMMEKASLRESGPQSPRAIHLTSSAMQRAFYDRARFMGDPDFSFIPIDQLTSKSYAQGLFSQMNEAKALPSDGFSLKKEESPETTHFSLMDKDGNVIVSTQTINGYFGSALVAEGTGLVLNNEMDDFATQVGASNLFGAIGGENNLIAPGKRPLSSMSPTIVMENKQAFLGLGTPSGTRIITCVALTLLNVLEYRLPLWEAVTLARYHHQWKPDQLQMESPLLPEKTLATLRQKGHQIIEKDPGCRVQIVQKLGDELLGVSDPREEGASFGN